MSKVGQKPITIPESVTVTTKDDQVTFKSDSKKVTTSIPAGIKITLKDNQLLVEPKSKSRQTRALHGLTRSLLQNAVIGLTKGFNKVLELQGTGFRVAPKDKGIELQLGFSHPVYYQAPEEIKLEVKENKIISISGINKQLVGQTAAEIRQFRRPDPYKGKGIRYQDEVVKLKPGKAAKTAGAEGQGQG